jgi:hypothetical protein
MSAEERFGCPGCGRSFRWKAEIAGRRMRCRCGEPVLVPEARAIDIDDPDFELQMNSPPPALPFAVAAVPALAYHAPENPIQFHVHPLRDLWLPSVVLLAGILTLSMSVSGSRSKPFILLAFWLLIAITALPPILLFLGYGLLNSRKLQIAIRSYFIAAFKFLAVIIATDAAIMALSAYGGFSWSPAYLLASFCCAAIAIAGTWGCFFTSSDDDFHKAGLLLSIAVWVIHFLLLVFAFGILASIVNSRKARTVPPPSASRSPAWMTAKIAGITDRQIQSAAAQGLLVREAREWRSVRYGNNSAVDTLVEGLYAAGATKVYVDMRNGGMLHPAVAYVELPANPAEVAACLSAYQAYVTAAHLPPRTIMPAVSRKFTTFALR